MATRGGKNLPAGVDCPASSDDVLNLACGNGTESQSDIDTLRFGDGCVAIFKTDAFSNALSFGVGAEGKEENWQDRDTLQGSKLTTDDPINRGQTGLAPISSRKLTA